MEGVQDIGVVVGFICGGLVTAVGVGVAFGGLRQRVESIEKDRTERIAQNDARFAAIEGDMDKMRDGMVEGGKRFTEIKTVLDFLHDTTEATQQAMSDIRKELQAFVRIDLQGYLAKLAEDAREGGRRPPPPGTATPDQPRTPRRSAKKPARKSAGKKARKR